MAREDDKYKAGVDFEWVPAKDDKGKIITDGKGNPVKTRRFFKKAEKEAMKAPKAASKGVEATKTKKKADTPTSAPTSSIRPKSKPADSGSRVGAKDRKVQTTAELRKAAEAKKTTTTTPTVDKEAQRTALKSVGPIGGMVSRLQVRPSASPDRTDRKITKDTSGVTYEQWKNMTRTERRERGLPVSPIGGEIAFNRFLSGITGEDYKIGGEAEVKKPKGVEVKRPPRPGFKTQTYAKGGMTKGSK
jgi:hypothetical protein